jgi:hypothetical protein
LDFRFVSPLNPANGEMRVRWMHLIFRAFEMAHPIVTQILIFYFGVPYFQVSRLTIVARGARLMSSGNKLKAPPMVYIKVRRV